MQQPQGWHAFFSKDPTGDKRLLIPVRVRECKIEGLLKQIVYIDLVGAEDRGAVLRAFVERALVH